MKIKFPIIPFSAIIIFIALIFITKYTLPGLEIFESTNFIREFILSFGNLAEIAYVLWLALAIPLPIPSTPFILAGGFIFGMIPGFILAMIGEVLGATVAFYLIRFAGRPLLYKLAEKKSVKKLDEFFKQKGLIAALISYSVPIFPSDVVSLFMGLTKVSYPVFLFLVIVGHIPRLFMINYLGSDLYNGITLRTTAAFLLAILFVLSVYFREDILRAFATKARESREKVVEKIRDKKQKSKKLIKHALKHKRLYKRHN